MVGPPGREERMLNGTMVQLGAIASVTQGMSRSGRGAGARAGSWEVQLVTVGDLQDDRIPVDQLQRIAIEQRWRTEKHLLRPGDVLVTARSSAMKAALVPPSLGAAMADASLHVVRASSPEDPDLGPYLWWYLTSTPGRAQLEARMTGTAIPSLSVAALAEIKVPMPAVATLYLFGQLIEESERAYTAGVEAARLRRALFRDLSIQRQIDRAGSRE